MQRAHPTQAAGTPAHGFGPWEIANGVFEHLSHDLCRRAARLGDGGKIDRAFRGLALFQIFARHTRATQEAFDGFVRCANFGAFALFIDGRAFGQQAFQRECQAARRGIGAGVSIGQTGLDHTIRHFLFQIFSSPRLHTRGNFLREKFDQEIRHDGSLEVHDGLNNYRVGNIDEKRRNQGQNDKCDRGRTISLGHRGHIGDGRWGCPHCKAGKPRCQNRGCVGPPKH